MGAVRSGDGESQSAGLRVAQSADVAGGLRYYSSAFLPAAYAATTIGKADSPIKTAGINNLKNPSLTPTRQRRQLDLLRGMNQQFAVEQSGDPRIESMIDTFELAFRMQTAVPDVTDLSGETPSTLSLYGINEGQTDNFGRQCLLARRMIESGVRYVEITHTDWDHHAGLTTQHAAALPADRPTDGRVPRPTWPNAVCSTTRWSSGAASSAGRRTIRRRTVADHNRDGFSMWLAGGGTKGGFSHGETDEHGYKAVEDGCIRTTSTPRCCICWDSITSS